jgi:hypothetical protein
LVDFVETGTQGPATEAALAHLEGCDSCETALTDIALLLVGLRRLGRDAARRTPAPDAWAQLAARIERSRDAARRAAWAWRMRLSGTFVGALVAALVVLPPTTPAPTPAAPVPVDPVELADRRAEAAYLEAVAIWAAVPDDSEDDRPDHHGVLLQYPDGIRPDWKEVYRQTTDRWPQLAS